MSHEEQYIVYLNIFNLINYRGYTTDATPNDEEIFSQKMNKLEYIEIPAIKSDGSKIKILLLAPNSQKIKSNKIEKFIKNHLTNHMLFITVSHKQHTYIERIKLAKVEEAFIMELGEYRQLIFNFPTHNTYPKEKLVKLEEPELAELSEYFDRPKNHMPKFLQNDTMVFWSGLLPGDVVRIARVSITAGTPVYYRIITTKRPGDTTRVSRLPAEVATGISDEEHKDF
jgi:DNA-directed RNA polymerase subunit H (RpoH/RPB5)